MADGHSRVARPSSRPRARGSVVASTLLLGLGIAMAAPGDLDANFGDGGLVSLKFSDFGSSASAVLQQPDGKLVVAGLGDVILSNDDDWIVVRLERNGTLDSSFGSNGVSTADYSNHFDAAYAVIRQGDGKLVLAGRVGVSATESDFALARFNADGTQDPTFGTDGWATVDLGGSDELALGMVQQSGGKFVVAGYTNSGDTYRAAFVRFDADGTLDTTFGTRGATLLDFGGGSQSKAYSLAQQPDGKLVAAGTVFPGSGALDVGIARVTAEGVPDTSFDGNGMVTVDVGVGAEEAFAVAIQPDAAIVVAGYSAAVGGEHFDGLLIRLAGDGSPDPAFGSNGRAIIDLGAETIFYSMSVQADGSLVTTGYRLSSESFRDMILARFQSNGTLDINFGLDGIATADFGNEDIAASSWGLAVMQQSDGKHVAAGYNFNQGSFVIARFAEESASPGRIGLTATSRSVIEADSSVSYTVRRTGGRSGAVSVDYGTAAGTALPGSDFEAASGTLTWNDGDTDDKTLTINLIDDAGAESGENFSLTLSAPTGGAQLAASKATTFIANEDGPGELIFVNRFMGGGALFRSEGAGVIQVAVARIRGSEGSVSVGYEVPDKLSPRTASARDDFACASGTLTWGDGEIGLKYVPVEYIDDTIAENDESFQIRLVVPGTEQTYPGSWSRETMVIVDNDAPGGGGGGGGGSCDSGDGGGGDDSALGLARSEATINEAGGSIVLTVVRSGAAAGAVSVDYATASGTATAGTDYVSSSGTLNWADGDSASKTISVNITDDTADESDETFTLTLSNPSAAATLDSNSTATIVIRDDDVSGGGGGPPPTTAPSRSGSGGFGALSLLLSLAGLLRKRRGPTAGLVRQESGPESFVAR